MFTPYDVSGLKMTVMVALEKYLMFDYNRVNLNSFPGNLKTTSQVDEPIAGGALYRRQFALYESRSDQMSF